MASSARSWWSTAPGVILLLAVVSSVPAWVLIALPVATLSNVADHPSHFPLVFLHMLGGTVMLVLGALNLYVGFTRQQFRFHRAIGYSYLVGGALGAMAALVLSLATVHGKVVDPFAFDLMKVGDLGWALAALSVAWMVTAAMALRAAINRRFNNHRDWIIRSYVLVWSFVLCRLLAKIPGLAILGQLGDGAALGWLSWLVPLAIAEICLQWKAGAREPDRRPQISPALPR
ncbi:MAG: DUF2306 domain-containing protein [Gammaproteobacteria bacterium]|nr:DUF2306 domain-containing protein [Gammaproteobacteria bacterium]